MNMRDNRWGGQSQSTILREMSAGNPINGLTRCGKAAVCSDSAAVDGMAAAQAEAGLRARIGILIVAYAFINQYSSTSS
mgnify:CR=1 FL=1